MEVTYTLEKSDYLRFGWFVIGRVPALKWQAMRVKWQPMRVKWQNITEVTDSPQIIVLFLSPRFGFIVPKRAFTDPVQASAFLEIARAYRRSASDDTQPVLPALPPSWPPAPQRIQ